MTCDCLDKKDLIRKAPPPFLNEILHAVYNDFTSQVWHLNNTTSQKKAHLIPKTYESG